MRKPLNLKIKPQLDFLLRFHYFIVMKIKTRITLSQLCYIHVHFSLPPILSQTHFRKQAAPLSCLHSLMR